MKNYLLKAICLLALAATTLPIVANDYLKIYFKDGHTERHYMKLVESISATKYDLDGVLHSDYQMQQIVMKDITYSYYLADIDSMSFKKVYEEQVKKDVETVTSCAEVALQSCQTVEDIEQHLEELQGIEGVESATMIPSGVSLQIRNWHKIFYIIPPEPEEDEEQQKSRMRLLQMNGLINLAKTSTVSNSESSIKVALANKLHNNIRWKGQQEAMNLLDLKLRLLGFDSRYLSNLDLAFFTKDMYEYDHVILLTHGIYDKGDHYLETDVKISKGKLDQYLYDQITAGNINNDDIDDFAYAQSETGLNYYLTISENYIKKCVSGRKHSSPSIFYNGACMTLKGAGKLGVIIEPYEVSGSKEMAKSFIDKENGFDIYMGYNEENHRGVHGGVNLFENMLNGQSEEVAFSQIKPKYLHDTYLGINNAYLAAVCKNDDPKYRKMFLVKTKTEEVTPLDVLDYTINGKLKLTGTTTMLFPEESTVECGFIYNIDGVDYPEKWCKKEFNKGNMKEDNVNFSVSVELKEDQKLRYRAFTYDGLNYNFGNICYFDVPSSNGVSLVNNGDMEGTDVSSFFERIGSEEGDPNPAKIINGVGMNGSRGIKVDATDKVSEYWDNQFWVRLDQPVSAGTKYRFSFNYRADKGTSVYTEIHGEPGDHIYWNPWDLSFGTEWKSFSIEDEVYSSYSSDEKPLHSIAFDLSTYSGANTYYFDNVKFEVILDGQCPKPTFTLNGNKLTIQSPFDATIYYTLDGMTPTTSSSVYSSPIALSKSCTIKAIAVVSGHETSPVATYIYSGEALVCPARITNVEFLGAEYHHSAERQNQMPYTVTAALDDMTDIEEWGICYYGTTIGEFPFESISNEQSKILRLNVATSNLGNTTKVKVDFDAYVVEFNDEVGVYVKKRDKATGELMTIYGEKYPFTFRYDTKPSLVYSDPTIRETKVIGTKNGHKQYQTIVDYNYSAKGTFWMEYGSYVVVGNNWNNSGSSKLYFEKDEDGQLNSTEKYWDNSKLGHSAYEVIYLRNSKKTYSNCLNFSGSNGYINNVWVSSSPAYSARQKESNSGDSEYMNYMIINTPTEDINAKQKKVINQIPYGGGCLEEIAY